VNQYDQFPKEILFLIDYVYDLGLDTEPDYDLLLSIFNQNIDIQYDWNIKKMNYK